MAILYAQLNEDEIKKIVFEFINKRNGDPEDAIPEYARIEEADCDDEGINFKIVWDIPTSTNSEESKNG